MGVINLSTEQQIKKQATIVSDILAISSESQQERGLNLFDKNGIQNGYRLTADGTGVEESAGYFTSAFIPVCYHNGIKLYSTDVPFRCWLYDSEKNPISSEFNARTIDIFEKARYVRITFASSVNVDTLRLDYSPTFGYPYYPYSFDKCVRVMESRNQEFSEADRNLVDKNTIIFGYYLKQDNTLGVLASQSITDYIPVSKDVYGSLRIKLHVGNSAQSSISGIYFFDRKLRMIYYQRETISISNAIEIPNDASYVRVQFTCPLNEAQRLSLVIKYACFAIDWWDLENYVKPDGNCVYNSTQFLDNVDLNISGSITVNYGTRTSTLIPVKPDTQYYFGIPDYVYMYDKNRVFIERKLGGFVVTTSPNCCYVAFRFTADVNQVLKNNGTIMVSEWGHIDDVGIKMAEDEKVKTYLTKGSVPFQYTDTIKAVYENHIVLSKGANTNDLYYSNSGWNGQFSIINKSKFPGIAQDETISAVVFFPTKNQHSDIRALIFGNKNGLWCSTLASSYNSGNTYNIDDYCSYQGQNYKCLSNNVTGEWNSSHWEAVPNEFGYFEQCNVWDIKGNRSWRIEDSDTDPSGERYRMYYPSGRTGSQGRFYWHNGPIWVDCGGQYARGLMFANYSNNYRQDLTEPPCVFLTLDAKNVYVMYEFGIFPRYFKYAGSDTVTRNPNSPQIQCGETIDFSDFTGTYSYAIKKRLTIVPSAEEKDPVALFEYDEDINVSSISGSSITLNDASSLNEGDVIVIVGSATGDYAKLLAGSINSTTGVADGNAYIITNISGNIITIADSIGNPKNNLFCRHIHGVSNFGQGVCVYTGEEYPEGWIVYISPYMEYTVDNSIVNNNKWFNDVVRLNSTSESHQKSLGVYLRSDGKMISISDSVSPYVSRFSVRGKDVKMTNMGLHIFAMEDIDDASKSIAKFQNSNCGYGLYMLGALLFYSDYYGNTYYSPDEGDTWTFICRAGGTKSILIGWDMNGKRFFFHGSNNNQIVVVVK